MLHIKYKQTNSKRNKHMSKTTYQLMETPAPADPHPPAASEPTRRRRHAQGLCSSPPTIYRGLKAHPSNTRSIC